MKKIVIASGKGGTGKTTVACGLANLAGTCCIADCDVDAANMNVLLKGTILDKQSFYAGYTAVVSEEKCTGCGICADRCRFAAITMKDGKAVIDPLSCEGCGLCAWICPPKAITLTEKQSGTLFQARTRFGPLVFAELKPGEGNSGKLVTEVRTTAEATAAAEKHEILLVDASPGIGCSVIASLTGADLVLLVTEPTISGVHDMKRIMQLTRYFSIPTCVCVNKADIDESRRKETEDICRETGVEYVGEIPYNVSLFRAQCQGLTAVEIPENQVRVQLEKIWNRVRSKLS